MTEEKTLKNEGLKVYEVGYLLLPSVEESKIQEESSNLRDIIEKNKGQFLSEGIAEMKALTYPMTKVISGKKQKFENAYFGWIKFEGTSEMINLVKEELDKVETILRFILINTVKENMVMPSKPSKFSFDNKTDKDSGTETIEKKEVKKEKVDKKELDETIDELVIE